MLFWHENSAVREPGMYFFRKNNLFYSDLSGLSTNQVEEQSVGFAVFVCSLENVTFRLEVDDGRNHF